MRERSEDCRHFGVSRLNFYIWRAAYRRQGNAGLVRKKNIYVEARGEGFDVKILREVVRLRKQDEKERDEHDSLLDVYMHALEKSGPALADAA